MTKWKAVLITSLAIFATVALAAVLFFRSDIIDISADTSTTDTPTEETENAHILSIDDSLDKALPGQTLTYNIKVNYRELVKQVLGKSNITDEELNTWIKSQRSDAIDRRVYVLRGWLSWGKNATTSASTLSSSNFATVLPIPTSEATEVSFQASATLPQDISALKKQFYGSVRIVEVDFDCNNRWGLPNWSPGKTCQKKSLSILESIKHVGMFKTDSSDIQATDITIYGLSATPQYATVPSSTPAKPIVFTAGLNNLSTISAQEVKVKFSVPTGIFELVNTSSATIPMETIDGRDVYTVTYGALAGGEVTTQEVRAAKLTLRPIKAEQAYNKITVTAEATTTTKETVLDNNTASVVVAILQPL